MEQKVDQIFKPQTKKMGILFLGSFIMLLGDVMLVWGLLSPKVSAGMKFILSIFLLLCLFYSIYFFSFPFITRLVISENGIFYLQPLYFVFCEWKNLSGLIITGNHLSLTFTDHAKVSDSIFEKILIGRRWIPLEIFVDKYDKIDNWIIDPVLLELQKYIPNLADEVKKIIL